MRRYSVVVVGLVIFFLWLVPPAFAQSPRRFYDWSTTLELENQKVLGLSVSARETGKESTPSSSQNFLQFNRYLIFGNLTPDNPFHFLKTVQEEIQLATTFNAQDKEKLKVNIAGERLDEAQKMAKKGDSRAIQAAAQGYEQTMSTVATEIEKMKKNKQNVDDLIKLVDVETAKHTVALEKVAVLAPQQAKQAVLKAVSSSESSSDKLADLTNRPALPTDMVDRLSALKAQGLLTEEEVSKIIALKTRTEAREELKKFVQGGIMPEADFLRMDENVKNYFPKDFYEIHEIKRFYTLKQLEEEKPSETTLKKVQEFAKTYKPGDTVPPDIRRYWGPIVHLEEIQTTFRPDLISSDLFQNNQDDQKKFSEIVERLKPRPQDLAFLGNYLSKNKTSVDDLPPEYQRMYNLGNVYGAACGTGQKWFKSLNGSGSDSTGGYCAPENFKPDLSPQPPNINSNPVNCTGNIVSAKSSQTGACSAYPADCLPTGWTVVNSCINNTTPTTFQGGPAKINCSSNTHFVSVPYDPSGGYCIPNYTPIYEQRDDRGNLADFACPVGYHRNYQGGGCLPDTTTNFLTGPLPPISINPGPYPQPFYPPVQRCSSGQHWVPEPISPQGGYCAGDSYNYSQTGGGCPSDQYFGPGGICTPREKSSEAWKCSQSGKFWDGKDCKDSAPNAGSVSCPTGQTYESFNRSCTSGGSGGVPNSQMGNCRTPGECYDWCKANPGKCSGFNANSSRPGDYSPSRESQEAACRAGGGVCVSWSNGACGCERSSQQWSGNTDNTSCRPPDRGCEAGKWWDQGSCACRDNYSYPSACTPPSSGCQAGYSWDQGTCACRPPCGSGTSWNGSYCINSNTPPTGGTTSPPSGYGSCSSGQYWNGSSCVNNQTSSGENSGPSHDSQEAACKASGGTCISWVNNACGCEHTGSSNSQPAPTSQPTQPPPQQPTSPPPAPSTPPQ
ncbi:hypothetical protein HY214_02395 [Candidatus Roizmanbacteria bacterium]|nr:hypothetical protein [Candidatus Roizmanbacteria bacterium]